MPFGLTNQDYLQEVPELHSDRIKALQTIKTDGGQIITRTIFNYVFTGEVQYRVVNKEAPFYIGIIPDDPSTYEDRLANPLGYHYVVRSRFNIEEFTGFLIYGQPIENEEELDPEVLGTDRENLDLRYINPSKINLFRGWFKRVTENWSYDYYVPVTVGANFFWESSKSDTWVPPGVEPFDGEINSIEDLRRVAEYQGLQNWGEPSSGSPRYGGTNSNTRDVLVSSKYRIRRVPRGSSGGGGRYGRATVDYTFYKDYLDTGSIFNYAGFTGNVARLEFKDSAGLFVELKMKNMSAWLSNDGVTKEVEVWVDTSGGTSINNSIVTRVVGKSYRYLLVTPNLQLRPGNAFYSPQRETVDFFARMLGQEAANSYFGGAGNVEDFTDIGGPPVTTNLSGGNEIGFSLEARGRGRYYIHFREDLIEINDPTLIEYPEGTGPDLNNPLPYNTDVGSFEFIPEDERGWTST